MLILQAPATQKRLLAGTEKYYRTLMLDTDNFGKKTHFPLPWVLLIRTKWGAIGINAYVGFLGGELMSMEKKSKKY